MISFDQTEPGTFGEIIPMHELDDKQVKAFPTGERDLILAVKDPETNKLTFSDLSGTDRPYKYFEINLKKHTEVYEVVELA